MSKGVNSKMALRALTIFCLLFAVYGFETGHKIPESLLLNRINDTDNDEPLENITVKHDVIKRQAPAPAGAIKLDVKKLLEKYKTQIVTEKTTAKSQRTSTTTTEKNKSRGANKNTTKSPLRNRRIKKEIKEERNIRATTSSSITLTTEKAVDTSKNDLTGKNGGKKQRSRIQIKKGPNDQEYEYEYIYYYYDDDEEEIKNETKAAPEKASRGQSRANIKRPSLDLVDNDSFNTHGSYVRSETSGGPSFPSDLPAGPVRFLGATPNESLNLRAQSSAEKKTNQDETAENETIADKSDNQDKKPVHQMDNVALELYALTQNLSYENNNQILRESSTSVPSILQTSTTVASTTSSTTTEAPPSSSSSPQILGRKRLTNKVRFGGDHNSSNNKPSSSEAPSSEPSTYKKRLERPSFGKRPRIEAKSTEQPSTEKAESNHRSNKVGNKQHQNYSKKPYSGNTRNRSKTPVVTEESTASTQSTNSSPKLPAFHQRKRISSSLLKGKVSSTTPSSTTAQEESSSEDVSDVQSSTTPKSRRIIGGRNNFIKPLRPGLKINLNKKITASSPSADLNSENEQTSTQAEEEAVPEKKIEPTNLANRRKNANNRAQITPQATSSQSSLPRTFNRRKLQPTTEAAVLEEQPSENAEKIEKEAPKLHIRKGFRRPLPSST